jgi:hypothetical protein
MKPETSVRGARELTTYERHRAELERKHQGRFAVMRGDELFGVFKTYEKAVTAVWERFAAPEPCFWQEIGQRVRLRPMWGAWGPDPDEPPRPPEPPFEVQFARELATYERHRAALEREHWGEFVLLHGDDIVGLFHDELQAINEGDRLFGPGTCIFQEIGDPIYDFPNCALPEDEEQ